MNYFNIIFGLLLLSSMVILLILILKLLFKFQSTLRNSDIIIMHSILLALLL